MHCFTTFLSYSNTYKIVEYKNKIKIHRKANIKFYKEKMKRIIGKK